MFFTTHIKGIPCQCEVTHYSPPRPMRIVGSGFGDAEPPDEEEFSFRLLDRQGDYAPWLETILSDEDCSRLLEEFKEQQSREVA